MLKVGSRVSMTRTFTPEEVASFAAVSKDFNPIHLDAQAAAKSIFGQPIVHGMLVGAMFSSLIATELPGPGSIYLSQDLRFRKPVFLNEEITASLEVVDVLRPGVFQLKTLCTRADGEVVIDGTAVVMNKAVAYEAPHPDHKSAA